ncbi:Crp/Fnr family transcriptional regulator [Chelativorans sp. YIM 93263]|uniref:Crp/Fnr family transcriptional regulator n=1 Tax=Chelativorans sp. YIM 93263 TaxID=2906648 RepID=UPI0023791AF6|nr:Crp/Fnr family transcriptional regulator [Chelativorans sp. YIM 93263]
MACYSGSKPAILDNPLFRNFSLDDSAKDSLKDIGFVLRKYPAHKMITEQGQEESRLFIVQSGWGCTHKDLPDGERQIIDFTLAGDVVGFRSGNTDAQSSFTAITELTVYEARVKAAMSAIAKNDELAELFFTAVSRQNAILTEHLANIGRRSALVRTGHLLQELRVRTERAGMTDKDGYDCPLTQYDLADALGLTAIHVNRMLRELREFGFLSFRKGKVEFLDPVGLIDFAQFERSYTR